MMEYTIKVINEFNEIYNSYVKADNSFIEETPKSKNRNSTTTIRQNKM